MKAKIQSLTQILCGDNKTNIVRWRDPSPEIHTTLKTHDGALTLMMIPWGDFPFCIFYRITLEKLCRSSARPETILLLDADR